MVTEGANGREARRQGGKEGGRAGELPEEEHRTHAFKLLETRSRALYAVEPICSASVLGSRSVCILTAGGQGDPKQRYNIPTPISWSLEKG